MQTKHLLHHLTASPCAATAPPSDHESFRDNELLVGLSAEAYSQFRSRIVVNRYQAGEVIFKENSPGDALYLIARGAVKISKKGRGGQQETLAHLSERDFFGEMALIDGGNRSAQAVAVDSVTLGRVDARAWDSLLRVAPNEVLSNFTHSVTRRLRQNNERFIEQMMRNERLSMLGATASAIIHDLNNPISQIVCACTVLQEHAAAGFDTIATATRLIRDGVERMRSMTRELSDFARGKIELNLKPVSMHELFEQLQPEFAQFGSTATVRLDVSYEGELKIDMQRILRVFGNLLRNARESMPPDRANELRFSVDRHGDTIQFDIADTGCGIPRELLPKIFEPFVSHGKSGGSGLGLAITKAIVEAHGGAISVVSSASGTRFRVELPVG